MKLQILTPPITISITISNQKVYLNRHHIGTLLPPQSDQYLWQFTPLPAFSHIPDSPTRISYRQIHRHLAAWIAQHPSSFPL